MAVILFYTPFNRRARDVESLMLCFKNEGNHVISLSQREGVDLNPYLKGQGIPAHSYAISGEGTLLFFIRHLVYFVKFCYSNKIDFVFSHLDSANFVASLGQYFIKARVFLCRHHIDEAALYQYSSSLSYRLTNLLAKKIIVVSEASKKYMIEHEKVNPQKLIHINLAYDFETFKIPSSETVEVIRGLYKSKLLLVTVCRLTKFKRPEISVQVLKRLNDANLDAKLLILGSGDMRDHLNLTIAENKLDNRVYLLGHVSNVLDYLAAADFVLHPSVLESSCVVIKEAGLVRKPVIVCNGVGDFDEYINDGKNGFSIDRSEFVDNAFDLIVNNMENYRYLKSLGDNLNLSILRLFNIRELAKQYQELLNEQR